MSSVAPPAQRLEVLFGELAELAGQRNAIDGRIVEIVAELERDGHLKIVIPATAGTQSRADRRGDVGVMSWGVMVTGHRARNA